MNKKKIVSTISMIVLVIFFVVFAGYLLILANGYKINIQAKKIQKTGMIYLKTEPKDVEIFLDDKLITNKTPARLGYLLPKRYTVLVKKDEFYPWSKTLSVESGQVEVYQNIILFKDQPKMLTPSRDDIIALDNYKKDNNETLGLITKDGEIWWGKDLITRMSAPVLNLSFIADKNHILLQINKEIHVIDLDGTNNFKLLELSSGAPSVWILTDAGKYIIYRDGDLTKKAELR